MSTKQTILHGSSFHFYREYFDEEAVHLECSGWDGSFEFSNGQATATIRFPLQVWEAIRSYSQMEELAENANRTDEQIATVVEETVSSRRERSEGLIRVFGSLIYGAADDPVETQIEKGIAYYKQKRERARKLLEEIDRFKQSDRSS